MITMDGFFSLWTSQSSQPYLLTCIHALLILAKTFSIKTILKVCGSFRSCDESTTWSEPHIKSRFLREKKIRKDFIENFSVFVEGRFRDHFDWRNEINAKEKVYQKLLVARDFCKYVSICLRRSQRKKNWHRINRNPSIQKEIFHLDFCAYHSGRRERLKFMRRKKINEISFSKNLTHISTHTQI